MSGCLPLPMHHTFKLRIYFDGVVDARQPNEYAEQYRSDKRCQRNFSAASPIIPGGLVTAGGEWIEEMGQQRLMQNPFGDTGEFGIGYVAWQASALLKNCTDIKWFADKSIRELIDCVCLLPQHHQILASLSRHVVALVQANSLAF